MKLLPLLLLASAACAQLRINAGGPATTDLSGKDWQADKYFTGGAVDVTTRYGKPDASKYATKRYGDFVYTLPVPDGAYSVSLYMIENVAGPGARVFSVTINGATVMDHYDVAAVDGMDTPAIKVFPALAARGSGIEIAFRTISSARSAFVNAIEITPVLGLLKTAAVTVLDGPDACATVTRPFSSELHAGGQLCQVPRQAAVPLGFKVTDLNFGGTSTALTPPDQTFVHGYSLPSPMSADNRYVGVTDTNGRHYALDRTSGARIQIPGDSAAPMWDAIDGDAFYFLSNSRTRILRHSVSGNTDQVAAEFGGRLTRINNGGSTHNSADQWTSVWSEPEHQVCAVNLRDGTQYCADYLAPEVRADKVPFAFIDFSMITDLDQGSGKRYVLLMAAPSLAVWSVDTAGGRLVFETRGPELLSAQGFNNSTGNKDGVCDLGENCLSAPHGDADSIGGLQYLVMMIDTAGTPCERTLVALPIAAGQEMVTRRVTVATFGYCSSAYDWPDYHIGCAPRTGACAISTTTRGAAPYGNQVMVMQDLEHVVKLGYHHSAPAGSDSYWYFPRVGISPDGRWLVYDSNSGQADEGNGFSHEQVFLMRSR